MRSTHCERKNAYIQYRRYILPYLLVQAFSDNIQYQTKETEINARLHKIVIQICLCVKDSGAHLERRVLGLGRVRVRGKDFTNHAWGYQVIFPSSYK